MVSAAAVAEEYTLVLVVKEVQHHLVDMYQRPADTAQTKIDRIVAATAATAPADKLTYMAAVVVATHLATIISRVG